MTVHREFGGMREVGDIIGALGFPRLRLWDSLLLRLLASNVDFSTLFRGAVGFNPFKAHLGVPMQRQVGVYLCCVEGAQVP